MPECLVCQEIHEHEFDYLLCEQQVLYEVIEIAKDPK